MQLQLTNSVSKEIIPIDWDNIYKMERALKDHPECGTSITIDHSGYDVVNVDESIFDILWQVSQEGV